jgi:signal transduction histidine kinase
MSVRLRLALTVCFAGLAAAVGVLVAVALAFERFEREGAYTRAEAFLGRVITMHPDLHDLQRRDPEGFTSFLKSLVLLEPECQLYLLAPDGAVLASTGNKHLPQGFKVSIEPVRAAASAAAGPVRRAAYVMGDDPEHMDHDAVIAARGMAPVSIAPGAAMPGYLYLVARKPGLPPSRLARLAEHLAGPALGPVLAVILLTTGLAAWVISAVTRPLKRLSDEVARAAREGFSSGEPALPSPPPPRPNPPVGRSASGDEFERLHSGFRMLLERLHAQWDQLRRLDAFRRESVSNLSHDLRSPLTAAAASLETLQRRWAGARSASHPAEEEQRLVEVALRNTHHAARLVRSLGDLAVLDEASFRLRLAELDLGEVLDDIALRFADRAAAQQIDLSCKVHDGGHEPGHEGTGPLAARVDIELFERAIANLLDNALRHTPARGRIVLGAARAPGVIRVTVQDSGCGIAAEHLGRLFDRHFRAAPDGGHGLGLAIVQRIAELHGGEVAVTSTPGGGTTATITLPAGPDRPAGPPQDRQPEPDRRLQQAAK